MKHSEETTIAKLNLKFAAFTTSPALPTNHPMTTPRTLLLQIPIPIPSLIIAPRDLGGGQEVLEDGVHASTITITTTANMTLIMARVLASRKSTVDRDESPAQMHMRRCRRTRSRHKMPYPNDFHGATPQSGMYEMNTIFYYFLAVISARSYWSHISRPSKRLASCITCIATRTDLTSHKICFCY